MMPLSAASTPLTPSPPADPGSSRLLITSPATVPTRFGEFQAVAFQIPGRSEEHIALYRGDVRGEGVLARVHSSCLTGDVLFSERCDCGPQLEAALRRLGESDRGVLVYLNQEGRGIGLANKLRAYVLQDAGADTVEANVRLGFPVDARDYAPAAAILAELGVRSVRLLTNNPRKVKGLEAAGLTVLERLPLVAGETAHNRRYLATKRDLLGHALATEQERS